MVQLNLYYEKEKSRNMKFIFKSHEDFYKIIIRDLQFLLDEQRHQRADLATINRRLSTIIHELNIEKQANEYYASHELDREQTQLPTELEDK